METRLIIMDILTFVCIPIYAEENRRDEYLDKLQVQSGNISTTIFNFQEKFWEHSYVMKSLFGYTEDIGISASYQFTDWVSVDAIFMPIEDDDKINYRMGVSFTPTEGLHIRLYGGVNDNNEINQFTSANMAAFIGYKSKEFALGAELNHTINSPYILNNNVVGYSIFASVKLAILLWQAIAALRRETAKAAPEASPNRKPRFRSGFNPMRVASVWVCPCGVAQCDKHV